MNQKYNYTEWIPFDKIYEYNNVVANRRSKFKVLNDIVTKPMAGIYLIADSSIGSLNSPDSLIYIGKTVGKTKWSSFHDRLWKHCCKALGECGGRYNMNDGELIKDYSDNSEPKDTENWAKYRINKFKCFSNWYFSFYQLDEEDFELAKDKISLIEDITMYAFSYYSNPTKAMCNGSSPQLAVKFPWL